jgi:hypothetical protein
MATKNLGRVTGKSAYEVWLAQGNTGSEQDFLNSLKADVEVPTKLSELDNDKGFITGNDIPTIPTKTSQLTNDSDFVEDSDYVHTDNNYTTTEKNKLSGLKNITVDSSMSSSSTNPVQNKVVKAYIDANSSSGSSSAIYQEYHTDYAGYVWFNDGFLVQWGRTSVTPTAINTDTTARITYTYSYDNIPDRKTEVSSATPSVAKVTSGGGTTTSLSKQGMNIYVNSSTTRAVTVDWLATGYKGT